MPSNSLKSNQLKNDSKQLTLDLLSTTNRCWKNAPHKTKKNATALLNNTFFTKSTKGEFLSAIFGILSLFLKVKIFRTCMVSTKGPNAFHGLNMMLLWSSTGVTVLLKVWGASMDTTGLGRILCWIIGLPWICGKNEHFKFRSYYN